MALSELEELNLREQLETPGMSELEELQIRESLDAGESIASPTPAPTQQEEPEEEQSFFDKALGIAETGLTFGTALLAEPIAGIGGIAKTITSGPEEGQKTVEGIRQGLTFQPRTKAGKEDIADVGEFFEPLGRAINSTEKFFGDNVFDLTGSPGLAAAAATLPSAFLEILGTKGALGGVKQTPKNAARILRLQKKLAAKAAKKIPSELTDIAPTIPALKKVSRSLYDEVDSFGVRVKSESYDQFLVSARKMAEDFSVDPILTPKGNRALERLEQLSGSSPPTAEIDKLRRIAGTAAKSLDPSDQVIGVRMIEMIDDLLADPKSLSIPAGVDPGGVSLRLKGARKLWGQARRGELIEEAFVRADLSASGLENGLRQEFRSLLKNKKTRRMFSAEEQALMKQVAKGTTKTNLFKMLGKFGVSLDQPGIIGSSAGVGVGGFFGGQAGGVVVPALGTFSKELASSLTERGAVFADAVIRSGRDGTKIVRAYLRNTPKGKRNPSQLAELLLDPRKQIDNLPRTEFVNEAKRIVISKRRALAEAKAGAVVVGLERSGDEQRP